MIYFYICPPSSRVSALVVGVAILNKMFPEERVRRTVAPPRGRTENRIPGLRRHLAVGDNELTFLFSKTNSSKSLPECFRCVALNC